MSLYRKQAGTSGSAAVTQFSFKNSVLHRCWLKSHPAWVLFVLVFLPFRQQQTIHLVTVMLHLTIWLLVNIGQITRVGLSSSKTDFDEIAAISICPVPSWTLQQDCLPFLLFPEHAASTLLRDLDSSLTSLPAEHSALYWHREGKQALQNRRQKHNERCGRLKVPWTVTRLMFRWES